jgi:isopentenyldiphosphate isomerase
VALILVDYILISKFNFSFSSMICNPDEVSDISLLTLEEIRNKVKNKEIKITPWFDLILQNKIEDIWKCLGDLDSLKKKEDKVGISILL